jgi:hypothetical protein
MNKEDLIKKYNENERMLQHYNSCILRLKSDQVKIEKLINK